MERASSQRIAFERRRTLVWVCDIEGSSSALNSPEHVDSAEEFLKRFYWLSSALTSATGGIVAQWTGDGFLAAYDVPLERDLGPIAKVALEAAWHFSLLVNVTQLGVNMDGRRFRVRHGVAYEPDTIFVRHGSGSASSTNVIGRGVVLAFRLSGIPATFPGVVAHRPVISAARNAGLSADYRKRSFSADEILKYFKGERWSTGEIFASSERRPRRLSQRTMLRNAKAAIASAENSAEAVEPWIDAFLQTMITGPNWTREVVEEWTRYLREDLLGSLKRVVDLFEEPHKR